MRSTSESGPRRSAVATSIPASMRLTVISFEPGTMPRARISSVWLVSPSGSSIFASATKVPLPWRRKIRCSASRPCSTWRTVARETPYSAQSSRSVGRAAPGTRSRISSSNASRRRRDFGCAPTGARDSDGVRCLFLDHRAAP